MIAAFTATAGLVLKGYSIYNAADRAAKMYQKDTITQSEAIDLCAQGVFAVCQVSAIGATALHAKNWIQVTFTAASAASDVTRKVTTIYTKKEAEQWTKGDIVNILATTVWRVGDATTIGLDGHLQHHPACDSWFCEHKDEILTDNFVAGTTKEVVCLFVPQAETEAKPEAAAVERNVNRMAEPSEAFLPLNNNEGEIELAVHWREMNVFPNWFHNDSLLQCHLTGCVIRKVVTYNDGNGGVLLFEKSAVEDWIANNPGRRPQHVTNWPQDHSFYPDPVLQETIEARLAEWAEITLWIHPN